MMTSTTVLLAFFLLLLETVCSIEGQDIGSDISAYYLDPLGNVCTDKIETIQKVEYESEIHCSVSPMRVCDEDRSQDIRLGRRRGQPVPGEEVFGIKHDKIELARKPSQNKPPHRPNTKSTQKQACHTMNIKECKVINQPKESKVKVKVCPDGIAQTTSAANELLFGELDPRFRRHRERTRRKQEGFQRKGELNLRDSKCDANGQRKVCMTKYKTECKTTELRHEVKEDYPNCKLEMTDKCKEKPDKFGHCKRVPAMRCKIEERIVVKTKPETKCSRVPREFCKKENCTNEISSGRIKNDDPLCYFREQTINEVLPEEKCTYTPKRICHPVETSAQKVPRGGKKRSLVGLDAVRRRKRSSLPPNSEDLLALESNIFEHKEERKGRQSNFGVSKKKGKKRRVVVKRRRQKVTPVVSRTIVPTTPAPTDPAKLSSREQLFDQPRKKFSGEDTFNSRRRQSLTLETNPKGSLLQPEQLFALASPTIASNSNLFIPAAIPKTATANLGATPATQNVGNNKKGIHDGSSPADSAALLRHQQKEIKLQQLQQQLLHLQRQQQLQQRLQHRKILDLEEELLRSQESNKDVIEKDSAIPDPVPTPIQLTPSPFTQPDNHRIDLEDDGSLKLSILIKESLKRTVAAQEKPSAHTVKTSAKPRFASFPTRIPHTLAPIPTTTPRGVRFETTPRLTPRPSTKKRQGQGKFSKKEVVKDAKGTNCRDLPQQKCQRIRVNPKPVWKNMTRKICRTPRTLAEKKLVQKLLERGDLGTEEGQRRQRKAANFHTVSGTDHQSQSSNTRTNRARSRKNSRNFSRPQSNTRDGSRQTSKRQGRKNRNNNHSDDPPNFSPFLNFPKFKAEYLERS